MKKIVRIAKILYWIAVAVVRDHRNHRLLSRPVKPLRPLPKPSARLRYRGAHDLRLPNIIANAERELRVDEIYTLRTIKLASNWNCITLEETGDHEFALEFFDEVPATEDIMRWYRGLDVLRSAVTLIQHTAVEKLLQEGYRLNLAWPDFNYYPMETHMFVHLLRTMPDGREISAVVTEEGDVLLGIAR